MHIWPSLLQSMAQTFRTDTASSLELQIGEVIRATLLEMVNDHTALLQVKGQTIRAQVETPLSKGSTLSLVVAGLSDSGQLEMKLLPAPGGKQSVDKTGSGNALPTDDSLSDRLLPVDSLLRNLGVKDTPVARMIVHELLSRRQSVSAPLVKLMETTVEREVRAQSPQQASTSNALTAEASKRETERIQNATIAVLVQMVKREIPISPASFQAVKTLWNGPPLQRLLTDRESPAAESAASSSQLTAPVSSPPRLSFSGHVLPLEQLRELPAAERGAVVQSIVNRLGLDHEARLIRLQQAVTEHIPPNNGTSESVNDSLKAKLLSAAQMLETGTAGNTPETAVNQALNHLTGQQLMNAANEHGQQFVYQFLSLPVELDRQSADAKIHLLTRKKNGKQLDPYNCFLYFHLNLPTVGELGIHVHVVEKLVSLRFLLLEDRADVWEEPDLSLLRQGLQLAGYHLGTVRTDSVSTDILQNEKMDPFAQLPISVSSGNFDLRV
jgi:hypothetical protein